MIRGLLITSIFLSFYVYLNNIQLKHRMANRELSSVSSALSREEKAEFNKLIMELYEWEDDRKDPSYTGKYEKLLESGFLDRLLEPVKAHEKDGLQLYDSILYALPRIFYQGTLLNKHENDYQNYSLSFLALKQILLAHLIVNHSNNLELPGDYFLSVLNIIDDPETFNFNVPELTKSLLGNMDSLKVKGGEDQLEATIFLKNKKTLKIDISDMSGKGNLYISNQASIKFSKLQDSFHIEQYLHNVSFNKNYDLNKKFNSFKSRANELNRELLDSYQDYYGEVRMNLERILDENNFSSDEKLDLFTDFDYFYKDHSNSLFNKSYRVCRFVLDEDYCLEKNSFGRCSRWDQNRLDAHEQCHQLIKSFVIPKVHQNNLKKREQLDEEISSFLQTVRSNDSGLFSYEDLNLEKVTYAELIEFENIKYKPMFIAALRIKNLLVIPDIDFKESTRVNLSGFSELKSSRNMHIPWEDSASILTPSLFGEFNRNAFGILGKDYRTFFDAKVFDRLEENLK